jgi:zinc protease
MTTAAARLDAFLLEHARTDPGTVAAAAGRLDSRPAGRALFLAVAGAVKRSVAVRLFWSGGPAREGPDSAGAHAVAMQALARSPAPGGAVPLAERLASMGVAVTAGVTDCSSYLDLRGPREYIHPALRIAVRALAEPAVDMAGFRAARAATVHSLERRAHNIKTLAGDSFRAVRATPGSLFARPPEGAVECVRTLPFAAIETVAKGLAACPRVCVILAGDQPGDDYVDDLAPLAGAGADSAGPGSSAASLGGGDGPQPAENVLASDPPTEIRIASPLGNQAFLQWGTAVQAAGVDDHVVLEVAAHILGGWTGSRWHSLFREQLGYTYGTGSSAASFQITGPVYCLTQVGMAVAPPALSRTRALMTEQAAAFVAEGPTAAEISTACAQLLRSEALFYDSTRNLMERTGSFLQAGLPADFAERRMEALRAPDPDQFRGRLRALMAKRTLVIVTDSEEHT